MTVFTAIFTESDQDFSPDFGEVIKGGEYAKYSGPYSVVPKIDSQLLETAQKVCENDIEVQAVPYLEVANPEGGYTATIAYL